MLYFVQQFSLDEEGEAKMLHKVQQFHPPQGKIARKYCIKYNNLRALGNIIPEMLYEIQHFLDGHRSRLASSLLKTYIACGTRGASSRS